MLLQVVAPALADSVAVHDAAMKLGGSLAGWLLTHIFTGMPALLATNLTAVLGVAFGLAAAWVWHKVWVVAHSNSTIAGQAALTAFWNRWGKLIGIILAAAVAGGSSGQWIALLPTILAAMPSAAVGGVSSVLSNQNKAAVSAGRYGAFVLFLVGASALLLSMPSHARAASSLQSAGSPLADASGARYPWLAKERFVGTFALGESWVGVKATDAPTPYGRLGAGWQYSGPIQLNVGFKRYFEPKMTWRLETELRFIFKP